MIATTLEFHTLNPSRNSMCYLLVWYADMSGFVVVLTIVHLSAFLFLICLREGFL